MAPLFPHRLLNILEPFAPPLFQSRTLQPACFARSAASCAVVRSPAFTVSASNNCLISSSFCTLRCSNSASALFRCNSFCAFLACKSAIAD